MNKYLLILFFFIFQFSKAQLVSINPDHALPGQTLTTSITAAFGVFSSGSGPGQMNDIYLQRGTQIIYASNFYYSPPSWPPPDSVQVVWNIPANAVSGQYDVHVITFVFPSTQDNVLTNGFTIGNNLVEGEVYFDANQNGTHDAGENGLANRLVVFNPGGNTAITNTNGQFRTRTDSGSYTITCTLPGTFTQTSSPLSYSVTLPPDTHNIDFGFYTPPTTAISQDFSAYNNLMRCNRFEHSGWTIGSTSNNIQNSIITVQYTGGLTFQSSSIPPTSNTGNVLKWNLQLQPFEIVTCDILFTVPGAWSNVTVTTTDSVFDQSMNYVSHSVRNYNQQVLCSMDPNDKMVTPEGADSVFHYTLKNEELNYTIRFQNTGTDTAFNINIVDTIDNNFDLSTFHVLSSSNPVFIEINNGVVTFYFDNIMLPDSNTDELNSHGYIIYAITPVANVPDYTVVENTAYIYFDFNAAVITNTTFNTLVTQIPLSVKEISTDGSLIYPNPVTDESMLRVTSTGTYDLHIYNSTGQEIIKKTISGDYMLIRKDFAPGIYYYQLKENEYTSFYTGKFIIVE